VSKGTKLNLVNYYTIFSLQETRSAVTKITEDKITLTREPEETHTNQISHKKPKLHRRFWHLP